MAMLNKIEMHILTKIVVLEDFTADFDVRFFVLLVILEHYSWFTYKHAT